MKESKASVILHPVRMQILQTLVGGHRLTVHQIGELLPEVPQATLYRHLNVLNKAGVIEVVSQHKVRGTVEKVYALHLPAAQLTADDLAQASRDDHMHYFMNFIATLIGDFGKYLQRDDIDFVRDGVGYRQISMYLTDAEFAAMAQEMSAAVMKVLHNPPAPGRKRRILTTVVVPGSTPESDA